MTSILPLRLQNRTPSIRINPRRPLRSPPWATATGVAINAAKRKIKKIFDEAMTISFV